MKQHQTETIEGTFQHLVYSPRGEVEGVLLSVRNEPAQFVIEPSDPELYGRFDDVAAGQKIVVEATLRGPSPKGEAAHPTYDLSRLKSIDGRAPGKPKAVADPSYSGTVARLNYAKHGEANGVVLDTGDFIHLRPHGFARLKLKVGDKVEAVGDAQLLAVGKGWAVEATSVNGKNVE